MRSTSCDLDPSYAGRERSAGPSRLEYSGGGACAAADEADAARHTAAAKRANDIFMPRWVKYAPCPNLP
jgi:hypothetical protein